jgi:hypothetical protein
LSDPSRRGFSAVLYIQWTYSITCVLPDQPGSKKRKLTLNAGFTEIRRNENDSKWHSHSLAMSRARESEDLSFFRLLSFSSSQRRNCVGLRRVPWCYSVVLLVGLPLPSVLESVEEDWNDRHNKRQETPSELEIHVSSGTCVAHDSETCTLDRLFNFIQRVDRLRSYMPLKARKARAVSYSDYRIQARTNSIATL